MRLSRGNSGALVSGMVLLAVAACGGRVAQQGDELGRSTSSLTVEATVSGGDDDAEEALNSGAVSLSSTDLEFINDASRGDQIVGIRFPNLPVPQGAQVNSATITFTVDESTSGSASLTVRAEDTDNAQAFVSTTGNISNRALTAAAVLWQPGDWPTVGEEQVTVDLASLVQEVVGRPGWQEGGALAFVISGQGRRTAESFNGVASAAPRLTVAFADQPACFPGQGQCNGSLLEICDSLGTFYPRQQCSSVAACNAISLTCNEGNTSCSSGAFRCLNSVLERCNDGGTSFDLMAVYVTPELCQEALPEDGTSCAPGCNNGCFPTGQCSCSTGQEFARGQCRPSDGQPCDANPDCANGICTQWFEDLDLDGFGSANGGPKTCGAIPPPGPLVTHGGDCCDSDANVHPDQTQPFRQAMDSACTAFGVHPFDYNCDGQAQYVNNFGEGTAQCTDTNSNASCESRTGIVPVFGGDVFTPAGDAALCGNSSVVHQTCASVGGACTTVSADLAPPCL